MIGFWLATAGFSLYETFDFLTFQETIKNMVSQEVDEMIDETQIPELLAAEYNFTLEGNAKAAMVIFMGGLILIFLG